MTGSHTGIGLAEGAFTAYMGLCGCVFIFAPHMPIADSFGALAVPGTEAHTIALVYAQGIGGFMLMMCLGSCPGPRGLAMAVASLICMMFKHKFVDGSGPPPEGFAMGFAVLAAQLYAGQSSMDEHKSKIGTYVFTGWMLLYVAIMTADPEGMLKSSYPDIAGDALTVGLELIPIMAALALMCALTQCPGALGRSMAMTVNLILMGVHLSRGITPPPPVLIGGTITALMQYHQLLGGGGRGKKATAD